MKTIAIINSGGANINSVIFALNRLNCKSYLTDDIEEIRNAELVILPGVGNAENAMKMLKQKNLTDCIKELTQPVLGICLGMQLLFDNSEEGNTDCLGIIPGKIKKITPKKSYPVPHMGWNSLYIKGDNPLMKDIETGEYCYFVHSYYASDNEYTTAYSEYSVNISAVVSRDNFYGCQFHPEKSGITGHKILKNFSEL